MHEVGGDLHGDPFPGMVDAGDQDSRFPGTVSRVLVLVRDPHGMDRMIPVGQWCVELLGQIDELSDVRMGRGHILVVCHDLVVGVVGGFLCR